ncbi:MAG: SH3 domain-containing protein, partial [Treponema sp.]|nr:SH3 domain-containing protein [Treponema sp.]
LVPSIISASAKSTGTVSVRYAVGKSLADSFDGVLTFKFEGMTQEVNFLYKKEAGRLRLEDATGATINGNLVTAKGSSPITLSFSTK